MASFHNRRLKIYASRWHLLATLFTLLLPFVFLLIFSRFAKIATGQLFLDIFSSLGRIIAAYFIALILGWLFAVLFYSGKRANIALPLFDVLQSFPTFAALPLATFFWGPSNSTVIIFLAINILWPLFFTITSALKLVRREWREAVEIYGLKGFNYFRYFIFPLTIPAIITGSIIGLGDGWEALVATEIIVTIKSGLGNFFQSFSTQPTITAFGILGFLILIFSINKIIWLPLLDWSHKKSEE